ncbi:hypothetical protein GCM10010294_28740 [Streptomyces griseoloalbus]|nr:hypothetical protein GCM10010294_28740 [Streptomyces griseoloalbus]
MLTLGSWDDRDADDAAEDRSGCVVDTAGGIDADEPECPSSLFSFQTAGTSATTMAHTPATTALASVKTHPMMATLPVWLVPWNKVCTRHHTGGRSACGWGG